MADLNQTSSRGDWVCPCSGCQKSVIAERQQLIELIKEFPGTETIVELIQDRNPKSKKKT